MPADLSGTWNLLSSDNFEGYMLALGRTGGARATKGTPEGALTTGLELRAKAAGPVVSVARPSIPHPSIPASFCRSIRPFP